jgi:peptidyl-prolyl cis-trans isomerase SurA
MRHAVFALLATFLFASAASGSIVERIVAVVAERPIFKTELHARARPHLLGVHEEDPSRAAAIESTILRELLERMIDERLEEEAAIQAHLVVTPEEIDTALAYVARNANLDLPMLLAAAKAQGLSEGEYRDERRQILEGKLLQLRVRAAPDDLETARRQ